MQTEAAVIYCCQQCGRCTHGKIGHAFEQTVIKIGKTAAQLKWLSVRTLAPGEAAHFRERVQQEEAGYQALLAEALEGLL